MKEYSPKNENQSRTLDNNPKAFRQVPISEALQVYKNRKLGRRPIRWSPTSVTLQRCKDYYRQRYGQPPVQMQRIDMDDLYTKYSSTQSNTKGVFQRIAWHEKANGTANAQTVVDIDGVNDTITTTNINVSGYSFTGPMYSLNDTNDTDNKVELIALIAEKVGNINYPSNSDFLTKKHLQATLNIVQTIPYANINTSLANRNLQNIYKGAIDPFILRAPGKTKDNERLVLYYQFGKDSYGYIVKIEQEGKAYTMNASRGQAELVMEQIDELKKGSTAHPLFEEYASAHDTSDPDASISETASLSTLAEELTIYPRSKKKDKEKEVSKLEEKSKRLDAITKIGGEGARWQCVREHALAGKLTNSSRFYTINYHNGKNGYIGITFQKLWGCWTNIFESAFNIDNDTVTSKLLSLYDDEDERILLLTDDNINDKDYLLNKKY